MRPSLGVVRPRLIVQVRLNSISGWHGPHAFRKVPSANSARPWPGGCRDRGPAQQPPSGMRPDAGYRSLSLEQVAADAEVTRVTIYRKFGNKLGL
ncbi:TetR/AcrR family transcriptional regulator, partial [Kribbella pittospori]